MFNLFKKPEPQEELSVEKEERDDVYFTKSMEEHQLNETTKFIEDLKNRLDDEFPIHYLISLIERIIFNQGEPFTYEFNNPSSREEFIENVKKLNQFFNSGSCIYDIRQDVYSGICNILDKDHFKIFREVAEYSKPSEKDSGKEYIQTILEVSKDETYQDLVEEWNDLYDKKLEVEKKLEKRREWILDKIIQPSSYSKNVSKLRKGEIKLEDL